MHYGYAQVAGDKVTLLAQMAELSEDIDLERARDAEHRAKEKLDAVHHEEDNSLDKLEAKLRRAMTRQKAGH